MSHLREVPSLSQTPDEPSPSRNMRLGLVLFLAYSVLYGTFMGMNAFAPWLLQHTIWGINLAVWYGLGLIIVAFILALAYAWLCRSKGPESDGGAR